MWFFDWWSHIIIPYHVKVGVHKTCGIEDITFFIYHETTYDHVVKESYDFVSGDSIS